MLKIRVASYGGSDTQADGYHIDIHGLTREEAERVRASMLTGYHWVRRGQDGRLEHVPSYNELPGPVTDAEMLPFWRQTSEVPVRQAELFGFDFETETSLLYDSPAIFIGSLCGYLYTPENYEQEAAKLTSWGFVCMRSKRNTDNGQFWEKWYLPGVWAVDGDLKNDLSGSRANTPKEKFDFVIRYLTRRVKFGTLDVVVQRVAMVIDD